MATDTIRADVSTSATTPSANPAAAPAARANSVVPWLAAGGVLLLLAIAALWLAFGAQQRIRALEAELVKRQQLSAEQSAEARVAAHEAQELARSAAAKAALLDARIAETTLQRSQLEGLMQSLARSHDESMLTDAEHGIRVAMQQSAITGSAQPIVLTLRQIDERLAADNAPQFEHIRRAIAADLERTRAASEADISSLAIRLDEALRQVDDLPLLVMPRKGTDLSSPSPSSLAPMTPSPASSDWSWNALSSRIGSLVDRAWAEVRSLIRVTPIDYPETMLIAPEQAFFLRENLKLRLLNARLGLLSRQFDIVQTDLRDARVTLERHFDRTSRRVETTSELIRQVASKARAVNLPRPDATLAAIATAGVR